MDSHFQDFLSQLHAAPGCRVGVAQLRAAFLATLPERERQRWPRWAFIQGLEAAGITTGLDHRNTLCAANVSLDPPPVLKPDDTGHLRLATA